MSAGKRSIQNPVEGPNAARYMLIMIVSFAITVVGTRLYLEVTGYPQLGNETFHFAHALWGGLLQAAAAVLMLIYLNEWFFSLSAALAGAGVGLFIDEVGKFITQTNDYFFPLAAPIIYVVFVLGVLGYLFVQRRERVDARTEMYAVLEALEQVLDDRMDAEQHKLLVRQLESVQQQKGRDDLKRLAEMLLQFLQSDAVHIRPAQQNLFSSVISAVKRWEERLFPRGRMRRLMLVVLVLVGMVALLKITVLLALVIDRNSANTPLIASMLDDNPLIRGVYSFNWYVTLLTVESAAGLLYGVAVVALLSKREAAGVQIASVGLIISLTIGNTLAFYFNQFSVVLDSLGLFLVLVLVSRYRDRFLRGESISPQQRLAQLGDKAVL